jgi:hypothetical protein
VKIYRFKFDVGTFQQFGTDDDGYFGRRPRRCKPTPMPWVPPEVYICNPLDEAGDFCYLLEPVASPKAMRVVGDILKPCCELLPLPFDGRTFTLINVLTCVDCVDHTRSRLTSDCYNNVYAFLPERVPKVPIFTIPKFEYLEVFTAERTGDPKTEFKAAVEHHGLKGLIFTRVWEG